MWVEVGVGDSHQDFVVEVDIERHNQVGFVDLGIEVQDPNYHRLEVENRQEALEESNLSKEHL